MEQQQKLALHNAVSSNNLEECKRLIEEGANIDEKDTMENTPLMLACIYGNLDIAKFLITKGANINAKKFFGNTPLMTACIHERLNIVKLLLAVGADKDAKNNLGKTALQITKNPEIKQLLKIWTPTMAAAVLDELNVLSSLDPETIRNDLTEYMGTNYGGSRKRKKKSKKNKKKKSIKRRK